MKDRFASAISQVFVHLPLSGHRFARSAAEAAECAASQSRFEAFVDVIFAKQDSIGLKPWAGYAAEAGVPSISAFTECLRDPPVGRIEAGVALADKLGIGATPTVIANGWKFGAPPPARELSRVIEDLLAGRSPFEAQQR